MFAFVCLFSVIHIAVLHLGWVYLIVFIYNLWLFAVNLPPTLSKSQVSSVRKNLKMQMLALLRLPAAFEFQSNITTLLTDLGATQSEVITLVTTVTGLQILLIYLQVCIDITFLFSVVDYFCLFLILLKGFWELVYESLQFWICSDCIVIINPLTARHFFFTLSFGAGQIFSFLIPGAG